ncbi:hypothetical protein Vi05172_g12849 [Venturia inaequalis]|uniref:Uncharacterized protein n=1 Tax=Venturia inaequalis TaxID=5025 RepID=A0A8H3Z9N4_VENIN|nr:hypothetical protein EG327_000951 [Venturia inaequalis]RDI77196.1 hypothetical protein Vi05172_g12849 [Venturia inaequalis]
MENHAEKNSWKRTDMQYNEAETTVVDYGHRQRAVLPTSFNPGTSLATIFGSFELKQENLDAHKPDDSSSRLRTLQQILLTPIQRPKHQPFAIPKYDYSNARWPCGRPLDKDIIRIEGRYDELADIARKSETVGKPSNFEGFKVSGFEMSRRGDEARTLLNTHAFAMKYKFQPIAAAVWIAFSEDTEKDKESKPLFFPSNF